MAASSSPSTPAGRVRSTPRSVARTGSQSSPSLKSGSQAPTYVQKPIGQSVPLSRRLLFPHLAPGAPLPPLLASSEALPELDAELYEFIALALRAFVNPWYTKLTRYDKDFLPQVTRILAIVFRTLEARLLAADLAPVVFRDAPTLVAQHYRDYRNAADKLNTSYAAGGAATLPQLFHKIQPHMAVSPEGQINEEYVRQAVDHILKTCMPLEDYEPETERFIVREIIIKVLLGSVVPKFIQPWFIQKSILDSLGLSLEKDLHDLQKEEVGPPSRRSLSFQNLIVFVLSAVQSVSGFCLALIHAYKQTRDVIKLVNQSSPSHSSPSRTPTPDPSARAPGGLPVSHSQAPSVEMDSGAEEKDLASSTEASTPPRFVRINSTSTTPYSRLSSGSTSSPPSNPAAAPSNTPMAATAPHYARPILALLDEVLRMHARYASAAVISTLEVMASAGQPFLDKLLPYTLYTSVLSGAQAVNIVRVAKRTLFPDGWPAPPPIDPTPEEQVAIRAALVKRLAERLPGPVSQVLLGPDASATAEAVIEPLSSPACNAHLVMFIIDLILLTLFPEMGVGGANPDDVR